MLLHACHSADHGHGKLLIMRVYMDVVVLVESVMQALGEQVVLQLDFGNSKHFRYLAAHKVANRLRSKSCSSPSVLQQEDSMEHLEYTTTAY